MSNRRTPSQPKQNVITKAVRALKDSDLAKLIADLRFTTKLEQSTLAKAITEQRRRKRQAAKEAKA